MRRYLRSGGLAAALALGLCVAPGGWSAQDDQGQRADERDKVEQLGQRGEVQPPPALAWLNDAPPADGAAARRLNQTWDKVAAAIEPEALPEPGGEAPAARLSPDSAKLIERAQEAIDRGEVFAGIALLRQAEQQSPGNLAVARRLGVAYMLSGNRVRGASYLEHVLAHNHADAGAAVLLCRHAADRGDLASVLGLARAIEQAEKDAPVGALTGLYRARALERSGYARASAHWMSSVLKQVGGLDPDALLAEHAELDPVLKRELRVVKTLEPALRMELGDRLLQLGELEDASAQYEAIDAAGVSEPGSLAARRAYVSLRLGQSTKAIDHVTALLLPPSATPRDSDLVSYLLSQGVGAHVLAERIEAVISEKQASPALLSGLSRVAEPARVMPAAKRWLADQPAQPAALREAVALFRFEDTEPEHGETLAELMVLTAGLMDQHPEQAGRYADAMLGEIDTLVCLLRALKQPSLNKSDSTNLLLLSAMAYERAGRAQEAIAAYQLAVKRDPDLSSASRLPLARLMIEAGQPAEALITLRGGGAEAGWDHFALTVRAMSAHGDHAEAMRLIEAWQVAQGGAMRTELLRAELIAAAGDPEQACRYLYELVQDNPRDERPYKLALRLIEEQFRGFRSKASAFTMRRDFLRELEENLPDSATARVRRALLLYDNPDATSQAEGLLLAALDQEPDNTLAWSMLVVVYDLAGEQDKAAEARHRLRRAVPPGVDQSLSRAAEAIRQGDARLAADLLRELLALDEEGVLPGPAMTGDDASSIVTFIGMADPKFDTESLLLKMVHRFPDNATLNNALGYQWAVAGKNLNQAKAMIQRAVKIEGENHAVLDSLAWVHYKLGDFAAAEAYQTQALANLSLAKRIRGEEMNESEAVLFDHMGDIKFRLGDPDNARRMWVEAKKQQLDPEQMVFEPELRTLFVRTRNKINALDQGENPPVAEVPGPESHGPEGHPADLKRPDDGPADPQPGPEPPPQAPAEGG